MVKGRQHKRIWLALLRPWSCCRCCSQAFTANMRTIKLCMYWCMSLSALHRAQQGNSEGRSCRSPHGINEDIVLLALCIYEEGWAARHVLGILFHQCNNTLLYNHVSLFICETAFMCISLLVHCSKWGWNEICFSCVLRRRNFTLFYNHVSLFICETACPFDSKEYHRIF